MIKKNGSIFYFIIILVGVNWLPSSQLYIHLSQNLTSHISIRNMCILKIHKRLYCMQKNMLMYRLKTRIFSYINKSKISFFKKNVYERFLRKHTVSCVQQEKRQPLDDINLKIRIIFRMVMSL